MLSRECPSSHYFILAGDDSFDVNFNVADKASEPDNMLSKTFTSRRATKKLIRLIDHIWVSDVVNQLKSAVLCDIDKIGLYQLF